MINIEKTQYISSLSGFKNKATTPFAADIPSQLIGVGNVVSITATTIFNDPSLLLGNLTSIRIMYDGLDSFWRHMDGYVFAEFPNSSLPTYEIGSVTYFTPTTHTLFTYITNESASPVTVPAFTLRWTLDFYDQPF